MVASVEFGVMAWACCLHRDADLPARPASMCFEAFGGLVFRVYSGEQGHCHLELVDSSAA